jgi:adenylate cyclase
MGTDRLLATASGVVCPLPSLAEAAPASGFFTTDTDPDGVIRQVPLLINFNGRVYPSLALATLLQALGKKTVLLGYSERGTEVLRLAGNDIPLKPTLTSAPETFCATFPPRSRR